MNIVIAGRNSASEYSGGRYHAWMMAEALAHAGHDISVWTDNIPVIQNDFSLYPAHHSIKIFKSPHFSEPSSIKPKIVILVPHPGQDAFFNKVILYAKKHRSRLILLNFETPNWYNSLSPQPKDASLWDAWRETARYADLILSSAEESDRFAQIFYKNVSLGTIFRHCYPSINSLVADRIKTDQANRQIIAITRFVEGQRHKGGYDLIDALCPAMKGYTLSLIIGSGAIESSFQKAFKKKSDALDIKVRFLQRLNDWEKFSEIKRSSLMLFLSYFEGFGLPPVESQYCDVPCIVYDLPVLREVSGNGLIYVEPGDKDALKSSIENVLSGKYHPPFSLKEHIAHVGQLESFASKLDSIIGEVVSPTNTYSVNSISELKEKSWRRELAKSAYSAKLRSVKHKFIRIARKITRMSFGI